MMKPQRTLVTDFDGTLTQHDFYRLAMAELIRRDAVLIGGLPRGAKHC